MRLLGRICVWSVLAAGLARSASAESPMTWADVRARFDAKNPTLAAGRVGIEESRAQELSAFLRPNPQLTVNGDVINAFASPAGSGVFENMTNVASVSYLHERDQKRELRRDSARGATAVAVSAQADLERNLLFSLRAAFVSVLEAQAFQTLAQDELSGYDQLLETSRSRFQNGDISQVDLDRLELQRVQYASDVQTAIVNLRTAKIQLLRLLDLNTPVDQFDVTGEYAFGPVGQPIERLRQIALANRPDLQAATETVNKARTDYRLALANGSTDPTISGDVGWPHQPNDFTPPVNAYVGVGVSVPLRLFDRNQGEKQRTELEITRSQRLVDATRLQVLSDVDAAYATLISTAALLESYRASYLAQASRVRDTITFSYQSGAVSLIEFLQAQQEHRAVQISYVNLVGTFMNAANQLNLAVGQEVLP